MDFAIEISQLTACRGHAPVLAGVDLRIAAGERWGLVGANGAGKTTLLHALVGLCPVTGGRARVCGLDPTDPRQARRLRTQVGLVFQNADDQLFCGTVTDDVAFGPLNLGLSEEETRARVRRALAAVDAEALTERAGHQLSAGEKRRVALAAVLAMEPSVLLLDEPTGELDPQARRQLIGVLDGLPQTRLITAHDLEFILATCTYVAVMQAGEIVATGDARAVLSRVALMAASGLEVPYSLRGARPRKKTRSAATVATLRADGSCLRTDVSCLKPKS
jgi:cobalt/nickel transport system ATP-binding protein